MPCVHAPPHGTGEPGLGRDPGAVTAVPRCPRQPSPVAFIFCRNRMPLGVSVGAEGCCTVTVHGGSGVGAVKHLNRGLPRAPVSRGFLKEKCSREITHRRFQMSGLFFFL